MLTAVTIELFLCYIDAATGHLVPVFAVGPFLPSWTCVQSEFQLWSVGACQANAVSGPLLNK